jgi:hypothetical protein
VKPLPEFMEGFSGAACTINDRNRGFQWTIGMPGVLIITYQDAQKIIKELFLCFLL